MKYNLSEVLDLIKNRRTIYPEQFSKRKVHEEQIEQIINSAIWAPTHGKTQPWRFTVFTNDGLNKLADFLSSTYLAITPESEQNDLKLAKLINRPSQASVVIAVHMKRQESLKIPRDEEYAAVAAAIQNMLLTATAYGLGSFWSTPKVIYTPEALRFFDLDEADACVGLIYLGYPEGEWPKGQRKPIEYLTEWRTQ